MKRSTWLFVLAASWLLAGCGHLDLASEGNPERALNGSVRPPVTLPAGAEVVVQVIDTEPSSAMNAAMKNDLPVAGRVAAPIAPRVLGEHRQTLVAPTIEPVPFSVEYHATDDELRHGLNLSVSVLVGGRVRFRTISAYMITLASSPFPQEVPVQALE